MLFIFSLVRDIWGKSWHDVEEFRCCSKVTTVQPSPRGSLRAMTISIQVSPGELIDKMTILEVKLARMSDAAKLVNVRCEHDMIVQTFRENVADSPALATLIAEQAL